MRFLEKNLEDLIFETPSKILEDRGFYIPKKRIRQLRIGNYGIADIVSIQPPCYAENVGFHIESILITVYELKKDFIDDVAIMQCLRYMKGIDRYMEARNFSKDYTISGVVVGSGITENSESLIYLPDIMNGTFSINFYTYDYNIDGISFKEERGYKLVNEGFGLQSPF